MRPSTLLATLALLALAAPSPCSSARPHARLLRSGGAQPARRSRQDVRLLHQLQHDEGQQHHPEQRAWPGIKGNGVILQQLASADPYSILQSNPKPHHHHHGGQPHAAFHLAITACDARQGWARVLSSTLLSVVASEVHPTTITVIWCRSWPGEGKEPSLFANWRLSHRIKVLYLPEQYSDLELRMRIRANYLMALNVPLHHGMPHLPLLVTEDDIVFAPDFNARLARVMQQVTHTHDQTSTAAAGLDIGPAAGALNAWVVSLYTGGEIEPVDEARAKWMAKGRNHTRWQNSGVEATRVKPGGWGYGTQAVLFSASMVPGLRAFFGDVASQTELHGIDSGTLQDFIIFSFDNMFSIPSYSSEPSLVEHVGASSSIFGNGATNARFHRAETFPFKVEMPADDPEGTW